MDCTEALFLAFLWMQFPDRYDCSHYVPSYSKGQRPVETSMLSFAGVLIVEVNVVSYSGMQ